MLSIDEYIERRLVHEIHNSERMSYRACRRRWDWLFRDNYYPLGTAKPLDFGAAYHVGMEVFYDPKSWDFDNPLVMQANAELAIKAFKDKTLKQKEKAYKAAGIYELDPEVEQDFAERVELGVGMMRYFFNEVSPREDAHWTPVEVELEFMVIIPHPHTGGVIWCKCDGCWGRYCKHVDERESAEGPWIPLAEQEGERDLWQGLPVVYAGRLDCLARDKDGRLWIIDWKTARALSEQYEFLYLDDQVGTYPWALREIGLEVQGFVYHEQKKGFPQPPKRNQSRRLGRLFSVAKNQDTDYDTYSSTVSQEDPEAFAQGLYDEFLEWLQDEGPKYYLRHQIIKTHDEMNSTAYNLGLEALEMINEGPAIYPSPGRFGCTFCAFRQPCQEKNDNGDYQYILDTLFEKRPPYYLREPQESSTESKGGR